MAARLAKNFVNGIKLFQKSNKQQFIQRRWTGRFKLPSYEQVLLNVPETNITILNSGIKVATENSGAPTCTVGLWMDAGIRYENERNNGVANFLEHMLFKGTTKRAQADLELEIENMGAHLNAYTSRELSAIYMKCLAKDLPKAVEILADLIQNSKLEDSEIEREKGIIMRELAEAETNFQDVTFDYLHSVAYQGTPLGMSVLGPTQIIKSITKNDLMNYIKNNFKGPRMVLAAAGGVKHEELVDLGNQHFTRITTTYEGAVPVLTPCRYTGSEVRDRDDWLPFANIAVAVEAAGLIHVEYIPLMIAMTMMGSWDKTYAGGENLSSNAASIISMNKAGFSFQSFYIAYRDTGLWGIYYVCEPMQCELVLHAVQEEWMRMCTSLTFTEVERAKNMLRANLLRQLDGTTAVCEDIGRQLLAYERRVPLIELDSIITQTTPQMVMDALNMYVYDRCPAVAAIGPVENLPDYTRIRAAMYWLRL